MKAVGVQFRTFQQVITAYEANDVNTWAVFNGKVLFMKGEGIEQLQSALNLLMEGCDNVSYTLQVYEDLKPKQVKSTTPHDGGFNFYLNGENQTVTNTQFQRMHSNNFELVGALNKITERLQQIEDKQQQDAGTVPDKLGLIGQIADHPVFSKILEQLAIRGIDMLLPKAAPGAEQRAAEVVRMAAVGNISTDADLMKAIEILKKNDPDLTRHLQRLATISETDKVTWGAIISALNN